MIGPLLFLLSVNDLPNALKVLALLFADDGKLVAPRTQNMSFHCSLSVAWDRSQKWEIRSILLSATPSPLSGNYSEIVLFSPTDLASLYPN